MNKKTQKIIIGVLVAVSLGALLFNFKHFFVAAMVNGRPITRLSLDRELERQAGKQALESQVTQMLITQEAAKQKINVTSQEVDDKVKEIEKQLEAQGTKLETILAAQGQTLDEVKEQIKVQVSIEKMIGKDIAISEEEIKSYYEKNKSFYPKDSKLADLSDKIKEEIKNTKMNEKFQAWLEELKKKAKVYYFLKL